MSEAVGFELSDKGERIRRNLVAFSFLLLALAFLEEIPDQIPLLGIPLDGQGDKHMTIVGMLLVQSYLLCHFGSTVFMSFARWRNRLEKDGARDPDRAISNVLLRLDEFLMLAFPLLIGAGGISSAVHLMLTVG